MKLYFLIIVIVLLGMPATSQTVANTKWKTTLFIPDAVEVNFIFKKDTFYMTSKTSDGVVKNFFIQRNDTLMIRKISGRSPCNEQAQGMYRIEWMEDGNKFRLHGISDECERRIGVVTVNPFERIHDQH